MNKQLYKDTFSHIRSACPNKMEVIMNYGSKNKIVKKPAIVAAAAIAITILLSFSVYALINLLTPAEIAREFGQDLLAEAFEDGRGVSIQESTTSHGYSFTLHGFALGGRLDEYRDYVDIEAGKSYFIISIRKADGTDLEREAYGALFASAVLFNGYKPWEVNDITLGGAGGQWFEKDGVIYVISECGENIEMFADGAICLAVWERGGDIGIAPSAELFATRADGGITFSDGLPELGRAMFTLPIDRGKADPERVLQKLVELGISATDARIK
jgi:hypothetical protein